MHTNLHIYIHTHIPVTRVRCLRVMGDTSALSSQGRLSLCILHTSLQTVHRSLSTARQLDWQPRNVWASRHVRGRNLSDKQLSEAESNWLVRRGGRRQQTGETECNRQVTGVISVSVSFSLIRPLVKQITFSLGFWVFSPFHLHGKILFLASFFNWNNILPYVSPSPSKLTCRDMCGMSKILLRKMSRLNLASKPFLSVTLYCTAGFGCLVIGNVLPGDSYHSCLSETGTLMACGDGCLKFSGEVCCWLRLCRSEIMSATGHIPGRQETGWLRFWRNYLTAVCILFTEKKL